MSKEVSDHESPLNLSVKLKPTCIIDRLQDEDPLDAVPSAPDSLGPGSEAILDDWHGHSTILEYGCEGSEQQSKDD